MTSHSVFSKILLLLALLCILCASLLAGCRQAAPAEEPPAVSGVDPADTSSSDAENLSVEIVSSSDFITVGTSIAFSAEIQSSGSEQTVVWSSNDPAIATVDENGVVTGVSQGRALITASSADGTVSDSAVIRVARSGLIFLSPSRQSGNPYVVGETTECDQAFGITYILEDILLGYGCEVYVCPAEPLLGIRAQMAREMDAICYVAIHTNAGSINSFGTTALYHPNSTESISLAQALYNELAALTPHKRNPGAIQRHGPELHRDPRALQTGHPLHFAGGGVSRQSGAGSMDHRPSS